jgi:hypothetical protein
MKQLTKEQADKLWGYASNRNGTAEILRNGQNGYCEKIRTIISCCSNCGDYSRAKIPEEK